MAVDVFAGTLYIQVVLGWTRCNFVSIYSYTYQFQEFGVYGWNVTSTHCSEIVVETPPANIYLREFLIQTHCFVTIFYCPLKKLIVTRRRFFGCRT